MPVLTVKLDGDGAWPDLATKKVHHVTRRFEVSALAAGMVGGKPSVDSRANAYVAEHGRQSWEVDALPPQVLQQIIRDAFDAIVDREAMDVIIEREKRHKDALRRAAKRIAKDAE